MSDASVGGHGADDQGLFRPCMPEVDVPGPDEIEAIFNTIRKTASGEQTLSGTQADDQRFLVLLTPRRMLMQVHCPPAGSITPSQVEPMEKMLPAAVKRNVAVIAFTEIKALQADLSRAIPFVGLLLGFAYIGHAVWIFEGHPSVLAAGCKEADILLVDGGMLPYLPEDWQGLAAGAMRHPEIYVFDRASFQLKPVPVH
jgi:hypothetical protein